MTTIEQNIQTCGLVTELTNSQTDNFEIIQKHWKTFNEELKKYNINQNSGNWVKYGITFKTDEKYFYLTAIPTNNLLFPDNFTSLEIPKGEYEIFTHKGKMENIKQTIFEIYKVILPKSNLKIEDHTKVGFIHFEKYDYRFQWNKSTSIIDIYLPLNTIISTDKLNMDSYKTQILNKICYTELVYERINKKLNSELSKKEIEKKLFDIIKETNELNFQKTGKNIYVTNNERNIRVTINLNIYRVITVDVVDKNKKTTNR
jgi:predicted transcriptional regulator YdeE